MSFLALDYTVLIHTSARLLIWYLFSDILLWLWLHSFKSPHPSISSSNLTSLKPFVTRSHTTNAKRKKKYKPNISHILSPIDNIYSSNLKPQILASFLIVGKWSWFLKNNSWTNVLHYMVYCVGGSGSDCWSSVLEEARLVLVDIWRKAFHKCIGKSWIVGRHEPQTGV